MGKQGKKIKMPKQPFVSVCMPTYNRRPFIPFILKSFESQTYPISKMELIIIDDGTDLIEDLVSHLPYVKYVKYNQKMTLGKKRNLSHEFAKGDVFVYMDDDDYYPPERVSHVVETLQQNPKVLCVGSSQMYIYFNEIKKMYQFGPYGPNHATAATFGFRRELLRKTCYLETSCLSEEKHFLKNYTIPFAQLDPRKTILVFAHGQNTFDKRDLIRTNSQFVHEVNDLPSDFIHNEETLHFFTNDIDQILYEYSAGQVINKPDVIEQTKELVSERQQMQKQINEQNRQQQEYNELVNTIMNLHSNQQTSISLISSQSSCS